MTQNPVWQIIFKGNLLNEELNWQGLEGFQNIIEQTA